MPNLDAIIKGHNRSYGDGTIRSGRQLPRDPKRIPTGVFVADYISGGGLPLWGTTCFWGGESGGKTTLALNTVKSAQLLCWRCFEYHWFCKCEDGPLRKKVYFGEVENTTDTEWAEAVGVDPDQWVIGQGETGEEHMNIAKAVIQADDVGLIIIDSVAALTPGAEMDTDFEDLGKLMAKQAILMTKATRILKQQMIREMRRGHPVALLCTNQLRTKIGQLYGSPETMSGGHGMRHEFSLLLRCGKISLKDGTPDKLYKNKKDKWGNELASRHNLSVKKSKVLTLGGQAEYLRVKQEIPERRIRRGGIDDVDLIMKEARAAGIITDEKSKGWKFCGEHIKTLDVIYELLASNDQYRLKTQCDIIKFRKDELKAGVTD